MLSMHLPLSVSIRLTGFQISKYKTFTGPFGKVFLGAVLTYQIIYWCWLKLEMDESKLEKNGRLWIHSDFTHSQNADGL